jgi:hypothetical protein
MDEPYYSGRIENLMDHKSEILCVELFASPSPASLRHLVVVTRSTDHGDDWATVGLMCPDDARALATHLCNAAMVAEVANQDTRAGIEGIRILPTIWLCGKKFFIDGRLRQLRNVEDPMHFFDIDG